MALAVKRRETDASSHSNPQIAFADVTLQLGGKTIIENLSLGVRPGEFLVQSKTADDTKWVVSYMTDDGPVAYYVYDRAMKKADPELPPQLT